MADLLGLLQTVAFGFDVSQGANGSGGLLALEQRWQSLFSNKCVLAAARA
jgi:hypothetical protein